MNLKFRAYDGENFWYFDPTVGCFYLHFGGEQSSFDDPLEFSEVVEKGWKVDQWSGQGDIYQRDIVHWFTTLEGEVYFDKGCFLVRNFYESEQDDPTLPFSEDCKFKVIGNTHEDGDK